MNYRVVVGTGLGLVVFLILAHFALWGLHAHWLGEFGERAPVLGMSRPQVPAPTPTPVESAAPPPAMTIDRAMDLYLEKGGHRANPDPSTSPDALRER